MKIKYQTVSRLITFLFLACIAINISAQKNESWNTFDLDEISISAPKHLKNTCLNYTNETKGYITHTIQSDKMISEKGKEICYIQIYRFPNYSIEEEFTNTKYFCAKEFENVKIKKCKTQNHCDLHYIITHEYMNGFSGEREYGETYIWLYKQGKNIFKLKIVINDISIIDKKEVLKMIYKIQSTFIIH